jgi:microcompartment protein CcmK/EutM
MVGAGEGELVLVVEGSSARIASGDANRPVDAVIIAILDSLRHDGQMMYRKS